MKSTAMIARQFRLREWTEQIKECNNRPHGVTVNQWCEQNGVTKANYYYRLKRVRKAYLENMHQNEVQATIVPVAITEPSTTPATERVSTTTTSDSLEISLNGFSLTVTNETPLDLLSKVLKVIGDA